MLRCAQHDRHCDCQTLNTERTEHRRDLSVEALEARRPQRTSNLVAARGRAMRGPVILVHVANA